MNDVVECLNLFFVEYIVDYNIAVNVKVVSLGWSQSWKNFSRRCRKSLNGKEKASDLQRGTSESLGALESVPEEVRVVARGFKETRLLSPVRLRSHFPLLSIALCVVCGGRGGGGQDLSGAFS